MHPRNIFAIKPPNFSALAALFPALRPFVDGRKIDFGNPEAVRQLTTAILQHHFGLAVTVPRGHLVPTVPQKLNYLHWIEDLVGSAADPDASGGGPVRGIDIGTGPCCIYALLGAQLNPTWEFVATDIDDAAIAVARANVLRNGLEGRIKVVKNCNPDNILYGPIDFATPYMFCMCNPPFFAEGQQITDRSGHRPPAATQCAATETERSTVGGEVAFTRRIVQDSCMLKDKVRWFTTMVGCKASLAPLLDTVRHAQPTCVVQSQLVQGKSHRWVVAWTFGVPPAALPEGIGSTRSIGQGKRKRAQADRNIVCPVRVTTVHAALDELEKTLNRLGGMRCERTRQDGITATIVAVMWTNRRQRRRKEQRRREEADAPASDTKLPKAAMIHTKSAPLEPAATRVHEAEAARDTEKEPEPLAVAQFGALVVDSTVHLQVMHEAGSLELTHQLYLFLKAELFPTATAK